MRRRLAFRNDKTLYNRKSSKSEKTIISIYPENTSFPVYDRDEWRSDDWDPLSYGQAVDFSRPFFGQWKEVHNRVPRANLCVDSMSIGSPFVNQVATVKNSYLIFAGVTNEDCYYGYRINYSKNCVDGLFVNKSELCYECIETYSSYGCKYCHHILDCTNSFFLYDCRGCTDCLFCVGLRNKSYCIFNVQYSKEEYEKKRSEYQFDTRHAIEQMKKDFTEFSLTFPRRFASLKNVEHVTGENIQNGKNCRELFDAIDVENVSYGQFVQETRDAMDINYGFQSELQYEISTTGLPAYNIRFGVNTWPNTSNLDYCDGCSNTSDCFGCVGLQKKQYCILNKQYTKEEYERLRAKLIEHMKETGEWGEFFPVELSPFAYNESTAMMFFPMAKEEVLKNGWRWQDDMPGTRGKETRTEIPDSISATPDSILDDVLACSQCKKNFKIIKQELAFYKKQGIPIPHNCFDCRLAARMSQRNPAHLYHRQCMCDRAGHDHVEKCPVQFETAYSPDRPEIIYCESCYQKEIA